MKCSLTISGGGLRSAAALGVIKYLEEQEIEILSVSGTSGGSILALLYAYGLSVNEIYDFLKKIKKLDIFRPTLTSLFSLKILEKKLRDIIKDREQIKELVICTTNLESGKAEYHKEGDMVKYVIASSSLIPFFSAVEIDSKKYADGGYTDNLPNELFKNKTYKNISINVNNINGELKLSPKSLIRRLAFIVMNSNIKYSINVSDIFINIDNLEKMNLFDFKKIDFAINKGYEKIKELNDNNEINL